MDAANYDMGGAGRHLHRAARRAMVVKRLVVIGASSGGIDALRTLAAGLPAHFPAAVCVVVHTSPQSPGILDVILNRAGSLPALTASAGLRLQEGRIYIAPPDHHLLIEPGSLRITKGPRENRFRPAIDPLFRSAAQVYGPAAVGVVLSGNLDDGASGLLTIKRLGGVAIVQDPADALFPSMPQSALNQVPIDHVVPIGKMAPLLVRLVTASVDDARRMAVPKDVEVEVRIAREDNPIEAGLGELAELSPFACPECHGVLLRLKDADPMRFRCHTGHAYSAYSLVAAINEGIESSLWTAMRALQEGGLLLEHLAAHFQQHGMEEDAAMLTGQLARTHEQAETIRKLVTECTQLVTVPPMPVRR